MCVWSYYAIQSIIHEEKAKNHSIPFIDITESWLKSYISDAQVNIPGSIASRSDRSGRLGGGALLYSHINLPISETLTFDDKVCEAVFCKFETVKKCIAIVYTICKSSFCSYV